MSIDDTVIFVYGTLRPGGIETLIVRMANALAATAQQVVIFAHSFQALAHCVDQRVHLQEYASTKEIISFLRKDTLHLQGRRLLLFSFDPISAGRCLLLESTLANLFQIKHLSGVFHPRAYFMTGERKDRIALNYLVALAVGKERLFFMNKECKRSHEELWHTDLTVSPIIALPIETRAQCWQPVAGSGLRGISVGRLVDFKAYNLSLPGIVRRLNQAGREVSWDIYGDGPLLAAVREEIMRQQIDAQVKLRGNLDYSQFASTVSQYDLFLGMGTAALEAAMLGVPTLCATVDEPLRCYGYLHQLPLGNVGELQAVPPEFDLAELISSYAVSTVAEKRVLSQQCRSTAEQYDMEHFFAAMTVLATTGHRAPPRLMQRAVAELYQFATESRLVQTLRFVRSQIREKSKKIKLCQPSQGNQ
ncbi:hypothetical protein [Candidatus Electronema sp. PJ]|uniref:hypothetical protein n=1 Tax=Candidatus Electronema sp. PJ TaxID=3401572 RepID=UPI003AA8AE0F